MWYHGSYNWFVLHLLTWKTLKIWFALENNLLWLNLKHSLFGSSCYAIRTVLLLEPAAQLFYTFLEFLNSLRRSFICADLWRQQSVRVVFMVAVLLNFPALYMLTFLGIFHCSSFLLIFGSYIIIKFVVFCAIISSLDIFSKQCGYWVCE